MNAQSNSVEKTLVKSAIPYPIIGGLRFYERKEVKDMVAYLSVINKSSRHGALKPLSSTSQAGHRRGHYGGSPADRPANGNSLFDIFCHGG